jgi:hypothetical protein
MKITSKEMYRLSKQLIFAGNFRMWLSNVQRKLGFNKLADSSVKIANDCFEKSNNCKKSADDLKAINQ